MLHMLLACTEYGLVDRADMAELAAEPPPEADGYEPTSAKNGMCIAHLVVRAGSSAGV